MKKIFTFLLFIPVMISAQRDFWPPLLLKTTKVHTLSVYDNNKQLQRVHTYNSKGLETKIVTYNYNNSNELLEITIQEYSYNSLDRKAGVKNMYVEKPGDTTIRSILLYSYTKEGDIYSNNSYNKDTWEYTYENGKIKTKTHLYNLKKEDESYMTSKETFEYDTKGRLIDYSAYNRDGENRFRETNYYSTLDQPDSMYTCYNNICESYYDGKYIYTYDEKGRLEKYSFFALHMPGGMKNVWETSESYTYNTQGLLQEKYIEEWKDEPKKEFYEYTFY